MAGDERRVPHVALVETGGVRDLLEGFPGRFVVHAVADRAELESLLGGASVDLVVVDCRERVPGTDLLEVLRDDPMIDFLGVGLPDTRRSLPSWMQSHWCPWPVDRRSFYRLITAMARLAGWRRAYRRQGGAMRALAEEAELGAHVAEVLHEISNPLDAVRRFVRLARDGAEGETRAHLDGALVGLDRMTAALHGLQGRARRRGARLDRVPVRELVRDAALLSGLPDDAITLETVIDGPPCRVPRALEPVLVNLLRNARQACGAQGRVRVEAANEGDRLRLAVTDDGEGFGELFRDELFRPWISTRPEGMGIGLHASRGIVEQLGGTLEGHSPGVNQGATFVVVLPLFEDRPDASGTAS